MKTKSKCLQKGLMAFLVLLITHLTWSNSVWGAICNGSTFVLNTGSGGSGPKSMALTGSGHLLVAFPGATSTSAQPYYIKEFSSTGNLLGSRLFTTNTQKPCGIVENPISHEIYVSLLTTNNVISYSSFGASGYSPVISSGLSLSYSSLGTTPGLCLSNDASNLYVANNGERNIKVYNTSSWALLNTIVLSGVKISNPVAIACDPTGNLYIVDYRTTNLASVVGNGVVKRCKPDGTDMTTVVSGITDPLNANTQDSPSGIAFDKAGNFYVLMRGSRAGGSGGIYKYASNGTLLEMHRETNVAGLLNFPLSGIVVAPDYTIYVSDSNNNRIVKYTQTLDPVKNLTATWNAGAIQLSWTAIADTRRDSVRIRRSVTSFPMSQTEGLAISTNITAMSFSDAIPSDGTYYYSVFGVSTSGDYTEPTTVSISVDIFPPAIPTLSVTTPVLNGSVVQLSWLIPESTSQFLLEQSFNGSRPTIVSRNISGSTSTFQITGLADGSYRYFLYAIDSVKNTSNASISATVNIDTTPPEAPLSPRATGSGSAITLTWVNPEDATSIIVKQLHHPTSLVETTLTENVLLTRYTMYNAVPGSYNFGVFAKDEAGNISNITHIPFILKSSIEALILEKALQQGILVITQNITTAIITPEIGKNASQATLNIQAIYKSDGTKLGVGVGAGGQMIIATKNAVWSDLGSVKIGYDGGQGFVQQSDGFVEVSGVLQLGSGHSSKGHYALSGGILKTGVLEIGSNGGLGDFTWTGGMLQTTKVLGALRNDGGVLSIHSDMPFQITGNYLQNSSGQLRLILKSSNVGLSRGNVSFAQVKPLIQATEGLDLHGEVNVVLDHYSPMPGDKIKIVDSANTPPRLASIKLSNEVRFGLPELDPKLKWETRHFISEGYIEVISSGTGFLEGRPLNYPNPFKLAEGTQIGYWLNNDMDIEIRIYTASGSEIYKEHFNSGNDEGAKAGYNKVSITKTKLGMEIPSGVYPYVLIHNEKVIGSGKMVVRP